MPLDYSEATKWFRLAAEQGDAEAQWNLGLMYHKGRGVIKDDREAVRWFRKAAQQGDPDAQRFLLVIRGKRSGTNWFLIESETD